MGSVHQKNIKKHIVKNYDR